MESVTSYYRVAKNDIAYIRFILEAYDGVAVLQTVDPARGIVALHQAPDRCKLAERIIEALKKELRIRKIDDPVHFETRDPTAFKS